MHRKPVAVCMKGMTAHAMPQEPMLDQTPDRLMLAMARGDRSAFAALFEAEAGRLIAIARRIVRRQDLAEEAVQDGFVSAWQSAARFDPQRGSARAWLTTIVRNRALNLIRNDARLEFHDAEDVAAIGDRAADAMAAMNQLSDRDALKSCLDALEEPKRQAILLCYVTGLDHGEVAATMKAPLGTVKSWIRRGVIALQECLS